MDTSAKVIARGKTKELREVLGEPGIVEAIAFNDITALDGDETEWFPNKGVYATQVNHYTMQLLKKAGIPVAYKKRTGTNKWHMQECAMWPYEVVAVRQVTEKSSIRKRNPELAIGERFQPLEMALFLKTTKGRYGNFAFEKGDPFVVSEGSRGILVCRPDRPPGVGNPVTLISAEVLFKDGRAHDLNAIRFLANRAFIVLEWAWKQQGCTLCDLKVEFGVSLDGRLLLADVIDPDSWRLLSLYGAHLDKQPFRDKSLSLEIIAERYREVAERVAAFDKLSPSKY